MPQNREVALPVNDESVDPIGVGIPIPPPPNVIGIDPNSLARGSPDTVVTVSGSGFYSGSTGLVNGGTRYTQFVIDVLLRITVAAADLANPGQLKIAVKNETASNWVPLTVQ